jgi:hypothetical protein
LYLALLLGRVEVLAAEEVGALLALLLAEAKHHARQQTVLLELVQQALP